SAAKDRRTKSLESSIAATILSRTRCESSIVALEVELCEKPRISKKATTDIRSRARPASSRYGLGDCDITGLDSPNTLWHRGLAYSTLSSDHCRCQGISSDKWIRRCSSSF